MEEEYDRKKINWDKDGVKQGIKERVKERKGRLEK